MYNVVDNWTGGGAGIACIHSNVYIAGNIIAENSIYADFGLGGGILLGSECDGSVAEYNIIVDNSATIGGGISCGAGITVNNNLILGNWVSEGGGGVFCGSDPLVMNNTILGNWCQYSSWGDGILCHVESTPYIVNNIVRGNGVQEIFVAMNAEPQIIYNDILGGWEGEGNIDCDPMFCFAENGNFHLLEGSCCIGAGQEGADIGAFGLGCGIPCNGYVIGDYNGSGAFNVADIVDGYSRLKTGLPEPAYECECPLDSGHLWPVAMDINNSCAFNVADVVNGYSFLKTGQPEPSPCELCPPGEP
jgi:hypothetical protein